MAEPAMDEHRARAVPGSAPGGSAPATPPEPAPPPVSRRRRVWPWILLGCGIGILGTLVAEAVLGVFVFRTLQKEFEAQKKAAVEFLNSSSVGKPPAEPDQPPADPRKRAEDARKELEAQRQQLEVLRKALEALEKGGDKSPDGDMLKKLLGDTDAVMKMLEEFDKETRPLIEDETLDPKPGEKRP